MDKLLKHLNAMTKAARAQFSAACGTSEGYLRKAISNGQQLGAGLCINIERESGGAIKCEDLIPSGVDWAYIRASTPAEMHPTKPKRRTTEKPPVSQRRLPIKSPTSPKP